MAPMNGYTTTPHQRQNRRRERPGSRTRRTLTRKSNIQLDCHEGILDARDIDVSLPSDKTSPSPLLRQSFDQSWQRWKARAAEEKALAEMDTMQLLEEEQRRLFGDLGDSDDDDKLYRMGILYNEDDTDTTRDEYTNTVSCDLPVEQSRYFPTFVIRHAKVKRSRKRAANRYSLSPLYLSFSGLSDDSDIAHLLSRSIFSVPVPAVPRHEAQPVPIFLPLETDIDIPQSLPPPSAFESILFGSDSGSVSISHAHNTPAPAPISLAAPETSLLPHQGDWTFITHPHITEHNTEFSPSTPSSEPETWILIDDS